MTILEKLNEYKENVKLYCEEEIKTSRENRDISLREINKLVALVNKEEHILKGEDKEPNAYELCKIFDSYGIPYQVNVFRNMIIVTVDITKDLKDENTDNLGSTLISNIDSLGGIL